MTAQEWGLIFSGCATLAAVWVAVSTRSLAKATKKQMEENTWNTEKLMRENTKNTQEMIKENSMLSWRNNVILASAELIGKLNYLKSSSIYDLNFGTVLTEANIENEKIYFLFGDKFNKIANEVNGLVKTSHEIIKSKQKKPNDKSELNSLYEKFLILERSFHEKLIKFLYEESK